MDWMLRCQWKRYALRWKYGELYMAMTAPVGNRNTYASTMSPTWNASEDVTVYCAVATPPSVEKSKFMTPYE